MYVNRPKIIILNVYFEKKTYKDIFYKARICFVIYWRW